MDDLIRRHLVRLIESDSSAYPQVWNEDYEKGFCDAINRVLDLPSAQPEIIRCKDCKHWRFDHTCREHSLVSPMMANEFCSRAERREG